MDPTNRPGYVRLYSMALVGADGQSICKWTPESLETSRSNQLQFVRARGDDEQGLLLVNEGDDPWFEPPVEVEQLRRLRDGGALQLEISWPQSPDSFAVIDRLLGRDGHAVLRAEVEDLRTELREARDRLERINRSLTFRLIRPLHALFNRLRGSS